MSARDAIAAAMSAAGDGNLVKVEPYGRQSLKAGDGFVKFTQLTRAANRFGHMVTYQVWIALPQDLKAAEKWVEDNVADLVEAFEVEVALTSVTAAEFLFGANSVNGLILEGNRAAD